MCADDVARLRGAQTPPSFAGLAGLPRTISSRCADGEPQLTQRGHQLAQPLRQVLFAPAPIRLHRVEGTILRIVQHGLVGLDERIAPTQRQRRLLRGIELGGPHWIYQRVSRWRRVVRWRRASFLLGRLLSMVPLWCRTRVPHLRVAGACQRDACAGVTWRASRCYGSCMFPWRGLERRDGPSAHVPSPQHKPWVPPRLDRSGSILGDVRQTKQRTQEPGGQSPATSVQS